MFQPQSERGDATSVSLALPTTYLSATPSHTATATPLPSATPTPTRTPQPTYTPTTPPSATASATTSFACPGALPPKLSLGAQAQVNYFQVSARSAPGFSAHKEHVLARGRVVEIIAGTVSSGDYLDFEAWMPEVDNDTYYLIPAP